MAYGHPEHWGYDDYLVLESSPALMGGAEEFRGPIHRYSRVERFEAVLHHLCGGGKVPEWVVTEILERVDDWNPVTIWISIQKVLTLLGERKYFNRVPRILEMMGYGRILDGILPCGRIMEKFVAMSERFDTLCWERKYFPSLRYVALRLLDEEGVEFGVTVPWLKTKAKMKPLDDVYKRLCNPYT
jgi:hypothetical protein